MPTDADYRSYYEGVGRRQRYNVGLHVVEGGVGIFGMSCFHCESVLPAYVGLVLASMKVESRFLVALPGTLVFFSWGFPQLIMGFLVQRFRTRKWLAVAACSVNRLCYTGMFASMLLLPVVGARASLAIFFGSLGVNVLAGGFCTMAWQDLLGRLVLPGQRGRFFGVRNAVCTIASAVAVSFVGWTLPVERVEPGHYIPPLLVGLVFFWASIGLIAMSREAGHPARPSADSFAAFWRKIVRRLICDKPLRRYTFARMLMQGGALFGMSLFTDYAIRDFRLPAGRVIGVFAMLFFATQILGSYIAGVAGDRFGFRRLVAVSAALYSASLAAGLSLPYWGDWTLAGFCLVAVLMGSAWAGGAVGHMNMAYEFGAVEDRPVVMATAYGLPSLVLLLSKGSGGLLADLLGDVRPVIAAGLFFSLASCVTLALFMPEPPGEAARPDPSG